jgi:hypothetical protein
MTSHMNLKLTDKSNENIQFIMQHEDIDSKAQAIRGALNFFATYIEKERAKVNVYSKPTKVKVTKAESDMEEGKNLCVLDFGGIITDENGNPEANGLYCTYDSYEKLTPKKVYVASGMINPLERLSGLLASGEKYRNTNKNEIDRMSKDKMVSFVEMTRNDV